MSEYLGSAGFRLVTGGIFAGLFALGGCTTGVDGGMGLGLASGPTVAEDGGEDLPDGGSSGGSEDLPDGDSSGGDEDLPDGGSSGGDEGCSDSMLDCDGACVDPSSDLDHCGACGQACDASEETCVAGSCTAAPVDPCAVDPCNGHGWCTAGACACDPGYSGPDCSSCDGVWTAKPGVVPTTCEPSNVLEGTTADDMLEGDDGPELLRGLDGSDTLLGFDGNDLLNGNTGADTVNGNVGRDEVRGGAGDDDVHGGAGDDVVFGGGGHDEIFGGGGNDRLLGGDGDDQLDGGDGNDRYVIDGLGHDTIDDPSGTDVARCLPGVTVVGDVVLGGDRLLDLSTGGTVLIEGDRVESILGCG